MESGFTYANGSKDTDQIKRYLCRYQCLLPSGLFIVSLMSFPPRKTTRAWRCGGSSKQINKIMERRKKGGRKDKIFGDFEGFMEKERGNGEFREKWTYCQEAEDNRN